MIPEKFKCAMKGEPIPLPIDEKLLRFPLLASAKIDGVRATKFDAMYSYRLKAFRSSIIQDMFGGEVLDQYLTGGDGELTVGPANAPDVCKRTTGATNATAKEDARGAVWHVFDLWTEELADKGFDVRYKALKAAVAAAHKADPSLKKRLVIVPQKIVNNLAELEAFEMEMVDAGWEGVILRDPKGRYKCGRSTVREGILMKFKRFADMEGRVIGFVELQHNGNEAERDLTGNVRRSSAKAGKTGLGVLGALIMEGVEGSPFPGAQFRVGAGFSAEERAALWAVRDTLAGRIGTIKYMPAGSHEAPRHPTWKLFRAEGDL